MCVCGVMCVCVGRAFVVGVVAENTVDKVKGATMQEQRSNPHICGAHTHTRVCVLCCVCTVCVYVCVCAHVRVLPLTNVCDSLHLLVHPLAFPLLLQRLLQRSHHLIKTFRETDTQARTQTHRHIRVQR